MATYPLIHKPSFSYDDFLMHNQYVGDITNGFKKASTDVVKAQAISTKILNDTINKNGNFIANTIDSSFGGISKDITNMSDNISTSIEKVSENFGELNTNLEYGFDRLDNSMGNISTNILTLNENMVYGLDKISSNIQSFHSDFNIAMGGIALQFEMQRKEMQQGFDSIINILKNRRKTDAKEDFRDGMEFYNDGYKFPDKPIWFKNAYKHLVASIQKYERNPLAHLHLAHIYHYQKDFRDFEKALEHYELCYTYAEADKKSSAITAQGYFYAGWLKASVFDDIDSAINLTKKAVEFDKKFSQAYYHLAKFYANQKDSSNSLKHLETAIVKFDRNYTVNAKLDSDFNPIEKELDELLLKLKEDTYKKALQKWQELKQKLKQELNSYEIALIDYQKISPYIEEIEDYLKTKQTYFNSLNILPTISKCGATFDDLRLKERDELKKEIFEAWQELKQEINSYEIAPTDYQKISSDIKKIEDYLKTEQTYFNSLDILPTISKCGATFDDLRLKERDELKKEIFEAIKILDNGEEFDRGFTEFKNSAYATLNPGTFKDTLQLYNILHSPIKQEFAQFLGHHSHWVNSVAFSPNGKYIASGSGDKTVRVWDIESKQEIVKFSGHKMEVNSVAFSPNGKNIASCSYDNTVRIWDIESKKIIKFSINNCYGQTVKTVAFSPNGKYIVFNLNSSAGKIICVQDIERSISIVEFPGHSNYVNSVVFSPNGKYIASGSDDKTVRVWDIESKKEIVEFSGHSDYVNSVAFSPNGKYIVSGSSDKTVRIWNIERKKEIVKFSSYGSVNSVAFSPNGKYIVSGSDDAITVWDIESEKKIINFYSRYVKSVAFSPNGKYIAYVSWENIKS